jgi:branched-subunit amino acid transport protein
MRLDILWLLLGMTAVTFLPRFLPLALLAHRELNPALKRALGFLPVSILAALTAPSLFSDQSHAFTLTPQVLFAAVPVALVSLKTRSLWLAVVVGMLSYWLLSFIFQG